MWNRPREPVADRNEAREVPGVIDTIGMGYEALLARPLLILPPVILDLYFWLGVHLTSRPLALQLGEWLRGLNGEGDRLASSVEGQGTYNIGELASLWTPTLRLPTFVSTLSGDASYRLDSWRPVLSLPWWGVLIAGIVVFLVGLLIGAEYLMALAAATRRHGQDDRRAPGTGVFTGARRIAAWYLLMAGLALLVFWPAIGAYAAAELSGAGASFWLILLMALPVSWAFVLFFFSVQAMFVDDTGPAAALRSSYRVVRSNAWSSLGMIVSYFLLTAGFSQVWGMFVTQPIGLVVAIVGHAIIGTGIIAATMVFYRDRVQQLNVAGRY